MEGRAQALALQNYAPPQGCVRPEELSPLVDNSPSNQHQQLLSTTNARHMRIEQTHRKNPNRRTNRTEKKIFKTV